MAGETDRKDEESVVFKDPIEAVPDTLGTPITILNTLRDRIRTCEQSRTQDVAALRAEILGLKLRIDSISKGLSAIEVADPAPSESSNDPIDRFDQIMAGLAEYQPDLNGEPVTATELEFGGTIRMTFSALWLHTLKLQTEMTGVMLELKHAKASAALDSQQLGHRIDDLIKKFDRNSAPLKNAVHPGKAPSRETDPPRE